MVWVKEQAAGVCTAPRHKDEQLEAARRLVWRFCRVNRVPAPAVNVVPASAWHFDACAYYRPDTPAEREWAPRHPTMTDEGYGPGINICVARCAGACGNHDARNWNWPGSTTDRTPYGVLCHELGHHCDWHLGRRLGLATGRYCSAYSERIMNLAAEPPITSYAPDPSEWFAEMFRLFVTNPALLRALRPRTHAALLEHWEPALSLDWPQALGTNVPRRVVKALVNKGAEPPKQMTNGAAPESGPGHHLPPRTGPARGSRV